MGFIRRPQTVWWRKVLFQVHLWAGIVVGLYVIVVGLSGSLLVFRSELSSLNYPALMKRQTAGDERVDLAIAMEGAKRTLPKLTLAGAYSPGVVGENVAVLMVGEKENYYYVFADPTNNRVLGSLDLNSTWIYWLSDLHIRLLGGAVGYIVNGIGALCLVLISLTGLVLWWPGIRTWKRAFLVNLQAGWKRINFDLHSAVGLYTSTLVLMWAVSAVYFVFPKQTEAVVASFSSIDAIKEPEFQTEKPQKGRHADIRALLQTARQAAPGTQLSGLYMPPGGKQPVTVFLARAGRDDFTQMDEAYFDPVNGKLLQLRHGGDNPTLGSKLLFWLGPLHFGVYWGMGIKILWAVLGLSLPLLTVTGFLMYWNRSLSRYWKRLKESRTVSTAEVVDSTVSVE